jgi:Flp pilus assembly protein TadB
MISEFDCNTAKVEVRAKLNTSSICNYRDKMEKLPMRLIEYIILFTSIALLTSGTASLISLVLIFWSVGLALNPLTLLLQTLLFAGTVSLLIVGVLLLFLYVKFKKPDFVLPKFLRNLK